MRVCNPDRPFSLDAAPACDSFCPPHAQMFARDGEHLHVESLIRWTGRAVAHSATRLRSRRVFSNDAEEAVFFVCDSSGEKDSVAQREKIP